MKSCIWWVNEIYEVSEDPHWFILSAYHNCRHHYNNNQDILIQCGLPFSVCRGQAYNGAENMQVKRKGWKL